MRLITSFMVASVGLAGCVTSPLTPQSQPQPTPRQDETRPVVQSDTGGTQVQVFPGSTVKVSLVKDQYVENVHDPANYQKIIGSRLVASPGMRTIVVAFQGFPTQGRYGLVNKGDRMGLWSPWSGSDWNPDKNLTRGTGWLDELQFAQSISFPTDKLGSGTIYTFEIVTEKGVYLESEDAKLEKGVRIGGPSAKLFDPGERISFGVSPLSIRL
ncbi:MAG: hypothetical protein AAB416_04330 [Patescibacteria group bacterium]